MDRKKKTVRNFSDDDSDLSDGQEPSLRDPPLRYAAPPGRVRVAVNKLAHYMFVISNARSNAQ